MPKMVIVAEVSRDKGEERLISEKLEEVINANLRRGYTLKDWRFSRVMYGDGRVNEMVVAVFVLAAPHQWGIIARNQP